LETRVLWSRKHSTHERYIRAILLRKQKFNGIIRNSDSEDVCLSSIPKSSKQEVLLFFNRDGYSTYCKEYREYWDWVEKRNEERYAATQSHGKNYDAKNMMHVFRLLEMAIEIGKENQINVKRPNREFLLDIKAGKFEYEDLVKMAQEKQQEMELSLRGVVLTQYARPSRNKQIDLFNQR
jgi:hypothetical protein